MINQLLKSINHNKLYSMLIDAGFDIEEGVFDDAEDRLEYSQRQDHGDHGETWWGTGDHIVTITINNDMFHNTIPWNDTPNLDKLSEIRHYIFMMKNNLLK